MGTSCLLAKIEHGVHQRQIIIGGGDAAVLIGHGAQVIPNRHDYGGTVVHGEPNQRSSQQQPRNVARERGQEGAHRPPRSGLQAAQMNARPLWILKRRPSSSRGRLQRAQVFWGAP